MGWLQIDAEINAKVQYGKKIQNSIFSPEKNTFKSERCDHACYRYDSDRCDPIIIYNCVYSNNKIFIYFKRFHVCAFLFDVELCIFSLRI